MVTFDRCDPDERTCKSGEIIDAWLEFKYIILVENEQKYYQSRPIADRKQSLAKITYNSVSPTTRIDQPKKVLIKDVELEKAPIGISIGDTNRKLERIYGFEDVQSRILPY